MAATQLTPVATGCRERFLIVAGRPESVAAVVVVAAWVALLVHEVGPSSHRHGTGTPSSGLVGAAATRAGGSLVGWVVMSIAMMGPAVLPAVRHVAVSSLRWRRRRAVAEFAAVYIALWAAFGAAAHAAFGPLRPSWELVAVALTVAAAWQLTPPKRRFLRDCHRAVPLTPTGLRATAACIRFGWVHGRACIGSCWSLMLVMVVVPSGHPIWSALLTPVVLHERFAPRPRRAAREAAAALGAAAVGAGLLALGR